MADILEDFDDGEAVERSADICMDLAWDKVVMLVDDLEKNTEGVLPGHLAMMAVDALIGVLYMRGMDEDELVGLVRSAVWTTERAMEEAA